jgi:Fe-S oxidoreductase
MTYEQLKSIVVLLSLLVSVGVFLVRIYRALLVGNPSIRVPGQWRERIRGLIVFVGAQRRLFRFPLPGTAHFFVFWGFLILSLTILQAIGEGLFAFTDPDFVLPLVGEFGPLALVQDLFALLVAVAVLYALYVRLVINPERYAGSHKAQGVMVLGFILAIMLSLLVMNGIRINLGADPIRDWRPVSIAVGSSLAGFGRSTQELVGETSYWIHLGVVLLFLTELPTGKHFHVVTSIPAILMRNLEPRGRLPESLPVDGQVGVSATEQFSWRRKLDFFTCTECGRCQEFCPTYESGLALSPKLLMMNLRDSLKQQGGFGDTPTSDGATLIGDVITEEQIWACATCYACDQECPLFIEHIPAIVEMRRYLVNEGQVNTELQEALFNLGRYGNSLGQSPRARAKWTQPIQPKIKDARRESVDYLWFVGDYASYSATLAEATQMTARVFQRAGLDFGILYESEQNAGNDVRRVGEDGLFEMLVEKNAAAIRRSDFNAIVTTDPHSYNTLKNEYPADLRSTPPVLHAAELLDQLIVSGDLQLSKQLGYRVTFHDPCYLGRYNDIYDAPRRVIEAAGCELVEMRRNRDRALCCGAGGGRIWMDQPEMRERPSEVRMQEAAELDGVSVFTVACPKDLTMYQDAAKTTGYEDRLVVKDLTQLVYEAL